MPTSITAPPHLSDALASACARLKGQDALAEVWVAVESHVTGLFLRRAMAVEGYPHVNVRIAPLAELAGHALRRLAPSQAVKPVLPQAVGLRLAARIVDGLSSERGGYLAPIAGMAGLPSALQRTFSNLREALGPAALPAATALDGMALTAKQREVLSLYAEYRRAYTSLGYCDPWDVCESAASALAGGHWEGPKGLILYCLPEASPSAAVFVDAVRASSVPVEEIGPAVGGGVSVAPVLKAALEVHACPGKEQEMVEIARAVMARAKAGVGYGEMAVLLARPEDYRQTLVDVFRYHDIPLYFPGGRKLSETPCGRAFRLVLEWCRKPWSPEGSGGLWRVVPWIDVEEPTMNRFSEMLLAVPSVAPWSAYAQMLSEMMVTFVQPLEGHAEVLSLLSGLAELDAVETATDWGVFRGMAVKRLEGTPMGAGRFGEPAVAVLGAGTVAGLSFDTVFVPGCTEGGIPAPPRKDPLLGWSDYRQMSRLGLPFIERGAKDGATFETLQFEAALSGADRLLTMTYPCVDAASGKDIQPSPMVGRLAQEQGVSTVAHPLGQWHPELAERSISTEGFDMWALNGGGQGDEERVEYLLAVAPELSLPIRCLRERSSPTITSYDGYVGQGIAPVAHQYALDGRTVSPTLLEGFCKCPFGWFLGRVLQLPGEERPPDAFGVRGDIRGIIVHQALKSSWDAMNSRGLLPLDDRRASAAWGIVKAELDRAITEALKEGKVVDDLLLDIEREQLAQWLRRFVEQECSAESGVANSLQEHPFGGETGTEVPLAYGEGKRVLFHGTIDRLDFAPSGDAKVLDYKTGATISAKETFRGGQALQLPVYTLAARALMEARAMPPGDVTAEYVRFSDGKRVPVDLRVVPGGEAALGEIIALVDESILAGTFVQSTNPGGTDGKPDGEKLENCVYCRFHNVCGAWVASAVRRKRADGLRANFETVRLKA